MTDEEYVRFRLRTLSQALAWCVEQAATVRFGPATWALVLSRSEGKATFQEVVVSTEGGWGYGTLMRLVAQGRQWLAQQPQREVPACDDPLNQAIAWCRANRATVQFGPNVCSLSLPDEVSDCYVVSQEGDVVDLVAQARQYEETRVSLLRPVSADCDDPPTC